MKSTDTSLSHTQVLVRFDQNGILHDNNIFVLKGDLNGENRSGAFLFLSGIYINTYHIK